MRKKFGVSIIFAVALAAALPSHSMAQSSSSGAMRQAPAATSPTDQAQVSQPAQGVNWQGVGVGAGTLAANVLYIPAKLVYGILGGIGGGAGYALTGGNQQVANTIWRSSLGGDYVVTPDMLTGKQPVHFSGPTQTEPPSPAASAPVTSRAASAPAGAGVPATTSSGRSSSSYANSSAMTAPATHPMDSGAGPIRSSSLSSTSIGSSGGGSFSGSSASRYSSPAPAAKSTSSSAKAVVPDTSIE